MGVGHLFDVLPVLFNFRYNSLFPGAELPRRVSLFLQPCQPARRKPCSLPALLLACVRRRLGCRRPSSRQPAGIARPPYGGGGRARQARRPTPAMKRPSSGIASIVTILSPIKNCGADLGVPEEIAGWNAAQVSQVLSQLKQAGVKALVSRSHPGFVTMRDGRLPRTDIYGLAVVVSMHGLPACCYFCQNEPDPTSLGKGLAVRLLRSPWPPGARAQTRHRPLSLVRSHNWTPFQLLDYSATLGAKVVPFSDSAFIAA